MIESDIRENGNLSHMGQSGTGIWREAEEASASHGRGLVRSWGIVQWQQGLGVVKTGTEKVIFVFENGYFVPTGLRQLLNGIAQGWKPQTQHLLQYFLLKTEYVCLNFLAFHFYLNKS